MAKGKVEKTLKIIIIGSSKVRRESLLNRYFNNEFKGNCLSTIGIDFKTKFFKFDEYKIKFNHINAAGHEKFKTIPIKYLNQAVGVILVFDITKRETLEFLESYLKESKDFNKSDKNKILIGNKVEL